MELDAFTRSYLATAMWVTNGFFVDTSGNPLDDSYGLEDISPEAMKTIVDDCKAFQESNESFLTRRHLLKNGCPLEQAGRDFFLTRNGHGAGFWDGDWEDSAGKLLTRSSKSFGSQNLYVGDDGKLYVD